MTAFWPDPAPPARLAVYDPVAASRHAGLRAANGVLTKALCGTSDPIARHRIHAELVDNCGRLGIGAPALYAFPSPGGDA